MKKIDLNKLEIFENFAKYDGVIIDYYISKNGYGYKHLIINNQMYLVHRLQYMKHFGDIEIGMQIHHIDNNRFNNNIENLQMVTPSENCKHRLKRNKINSKFFINGVEIKLKDVAKLLGRKGFRINEGLKFNINKILKELKNNNIEWMLMS